MNHPASNAIGRLLSAGHDVLADCVGCAWSLAFLAGLMLWIVPATLAQDQPPGAVQVPSPEWSRQLGGEMTFNSSSMMMDINDQNELVVMGITLDPSGVQTPALVRYCLDGEGQLLASEHLGELSFYPDTLTEIVIDSAGNIYIASSVPRDPGMGGHSLIVLKLDSQGNELWLEQLHSKGNDNFRAMALDSQGNIYITGDTNGVLGESNAGSYDAHLIKYDSAGNHVWTRQFGTEAFDQGCNLAIDDQDNIYVVGDTYGNMAQPVVGETDTFLVKFDSQGQTLWTTQHSMGEKDMGTRLVLDPQGGIYVGGILDYGNHRAVFISRLDEHGGHVWSHSVGDDRTSVWLKKIEVDRQGGVYIFGNTRGDLGGSNAGRDDMFLWKYDGDGQVLWTEMSGTHEHDFARDLLIDDQGDIYLAGSTRGRFIDTPEDDEGHLVILKYEAE